MRRLTRALLAALAAAVVLTVALLLTAPAPASPPAPTARMLPVEDLGQPKGTHLCRAGTQYPWRDNTVEWVCDGYVPNPPGRCYLAGDTKVVCAVTKP